MRFTSPCNDHCTDKTLGAPAPFSAGEPLSWADTFFPANNTRMFGAVKGVGAWANDLGWGALVTDGGLLRYAQHGSEPTTLAPRSGRGCVCGQAGFGEAGNCSGVVEPLTCGLRGVAGAPDGSVIYFTDSAVGALVAFNQTPPTGTFTKLTMFAYPAGVAAGANGTVFVADFGSGAIYQVAWGGGGGGGLVATHKTPGSAPWALALDEARGRLYFTDADPWARNATAVYALPLGGSPGAVLTIANATMVAGGEDCALPGNATLAVDSASGVVYAAGAGDAVIFSFTPFGGPRVVTLDVGALVTLAFFERAGTFKWGDAFFDKGAFLSRGFVLSQVEPRWTAATGGVYAGRLATLTASTSENPTLSPDDFQAPPAAAIAPVINGARDAAAAAAFFAGGGATFSAGWVQRLLEYPAPASATSALLATVGWAFAFDNAFTGAYTAKWAPLAAFLTNVSAGSNGTASLEQISVGRLQRVIAKAAGAAMAAACRPCAKCTRPGMKAGVPNEGAGFYKMWAAPLWGPFGLPRVAITVSGADSAALDCTEGAVNNTAPSAQRFRLEFLQELEKELGLGGDGGALGGANALLLIVIGGAAGTVLICCFCCVYVFCRFPCQTGGGKEGASVQHG